MPVIEWVQECNDCKGTGLYAGVGEKGGAAVVCYRCDGTGRLERRVEYSEFTGRKKHPKARHVYYRNPGVCVDAGVVVPGGVPVEEWERDPESPRRHGAEMRQHVCPAWWYQTVDYDRKPKWDRCIGIGAFHDCKHHQTPERLVACWARWDEENKEQP
jgi:hypothetical protein